MNASRGVKQSSAARPRDTFPSWNSSRASSLDASPEALARFRAAASNSSSGRSTFTDCIPKSTLSPSPVSSATNRVPNPNFGLLHRHHLLLKRTQDKGSQGLVAFLDKGLQGSGSSMVILISLIMTERPAPRQMLHSTRSQCHHRIDSRSSAGGEISGENSHHNQQGSYPDKCDRIAGGHTKQQALQRARQRSRGCHSQRQPQGSQSKRLQKNLALHMRRGGPQRHSNSNLLHPLIHRVRNHRVDP